MGVKVTEIKCPEKWESINDWDSHKPALWLVLTNCEDGETFVEFGAGLGSTPFIKEYCEENVRAFYSFDTDMEWAEKTGAIYIPDFKSLEFNPTPKVLFVDGKPGEERKDLIGIHKDTPIIIAHDTESGADYVYGMSEILSQFKYRVDYCPIGKPQTTIISNKVNIEEWVSRRD